MTDNYFSFRGNHIESGATSTMRLNMIGNKLFKTVGKSQSCMVYKLPIIFKRTRSSSILIVVIIVVVPWVSTRHWRILLDWRRWGSSRTSHHDNWASWWTHAITSPHRSTMVTHDVYIILLPSYTTQNQTHTHTHTHTYIIYTWWWWWWWWWW